MDVYKKLREHFDSGPIPFPATKSGVEINLFKEVFSEEDCRIMLNLGWLRVPAEKIFKHLQKSNFPESNLTLAQVKEKLYDLYLNGSINMKIKKGVRKYCLDPVVIGWYEHKVDRLTPKQVRLFNSYADQGDFTKIWGGDGVGKGTPPQMRVIVHPNSVGNISYESELEEERTININKSLYYEPTIANYDDVRRLLQDLPEDHLFVVVDCICKKSQDLLNEPCKMTDDRKHCLSLGEGAQKYLDRGQGEKISKQDAIELLEWQIKQGLVLQCGNYIDELREVCACCGCCCGVLVNAKKLERPIDIFHVRYYAQIDQNKCKDCGICEKRCQMEAITKNSSEENPYLQVNLDRCIGCGICVEGCKFGAIKLIKRKVHEPPKDKDDLIKQRIKDRFGTWGFVKFALKALLGMRV